MLSEFRTLTSAVIQGTLSASDVIYAPGGNSNIWNLNSGGGYDDSFIQASSANWESTYTTVGANSGIWGGAAALAYNAPAGAYSLEIGLLDGNTQTGNNALTIQPGDSRTSSLYVAEGNGSIAIGKNTRAQDTGGIAIGWDASVASTVNSTYSIAVGYKSGCQNNASVAIGYETIAGMQASGSNSTVAIGPQIINTGTRSVAIGSQQGPSYSPGGTGSIGSNAISIGYRTFAEGEDSIAIGKGVRTSIANTAEVGIWGNPGFNPGYDAVRYAGIHIDRNSDNPMTSMSLLSSETAPLDGGAINGAEPAGTLPRKMVNLRRYESNFYIDANDSVGNITTIPVGGVYDDSLLQSTSGNWDSTYTTVSSNSATWVKYDVEDIATPATWVLDEDNLGSNSDTKVPTQQSVKKYIDDIVTGINSLKGGYEASTDSPPLTAGTGVLQGDTYYVTISGAFYETSVDKGDLIIATIDNADEIGEWVVVNRNIDDQLIDLWNSNYTTVNTESGNWDSTYNTVTSLSNTWDDQFDSTEIEAASANWNSTYTTVTNESADWASTYTTVDTESANWESTYSTVGTYSADWESGGTGDFCGSVVTMDQLSSCGTGTISVSANLDVNDNTINNVHSIQFHLDDTIAPVEGNLNWNETEGTLDLGLKGSAGNEIGVMLGMEQVLKVKSTEDVTRGEVVYISSAQGSHPLVTIASNDSQVASHAVAGIAAHDIDSNKFGYITTQGILSGIDTSGISAGDNIYLGVDGSLTNVVPTTPDHEVRLGYCIIGAAAPEGKMYVSIDLGYDIEDLHDVGITSIQDKDVLSYNSSTSVFENVTSDNWESTYTTVSAQSGVWSAGGSSAVVYEPGLNGAGIDSNAAALVAKLPSGYSLLDQQTAPNPRGFGSVDLQVVRQNADEVTGATRSSILGGAWNKIKTWGGSFDSYTTYSSIVGGKGNEIYRGAYGCILNGDNNKIGGVEPGTPGSETPAQFGTYSIACGQHCEVLYPNCFMFNDENVTFQTLKQKTFNIHAKNGLRLVTGTSLTPDPINIGDVLTCYDTDGHSKWASLSADEWNSTYTTVGANSAAWDGAVYEVSEPAGIYNKQLALFNDTNEIFKSSKLSWNINTLVITGSLGADGLTIGTSGSTFNSNINMLNNGINTITTLGMVGAAAISNVSTFNGVDVTAFSTDVTNWNSTYTTVGANSGIWESTYTTVSAQSANWSEGASTGVVFTESTAKGGATTTAALIVKEPGTSGYPDYDASNPGGERGKLAVDLQMKRDADASIALTQVAGSYASAILGGQYNLINSGYDGTSYGAAAVITGGQFNKIDAGQRSAILGGSNNIIGEEFGLPGNDSIASGKYCFVKHNNTFTWNDGGGGLGDDGTAIFETKKKQTFNIHAHEGLRLVTGSSATPDPINIGDVLTCYDTDGHSKWASLSADEWNSTYTTVGANSATWDTTSVYTVSTLPTAIGAAGARAFVSDSDATHAAGIGTVVVNTGSGAEFTPVYSDGADWLIG